MRLQWTRDPEPEERSLWRFLSPAADPTGSDITRRLPQELLCYIFSFLELRDLLPIAPGRRDELREGDIIIASGIGVIAVRGKFLLYRRDDCR